MIKKCKQCVLDTTVPEIKFDQEGICNFCKLHFEFQKFYPISKKKLLELKSKILNHNKNGKYDCICGVSGGRDSTYNLYIVKKIMKLNPLAVHYDNGWGTKISTENIKNSCDKLKVDLVTVVEDWSTFKNIQKAFLYSSVPDIDVPTDIGILKATYDIADKFNIKYILNGHSFRNEGFDPLNWTYIDGKYLEDVSLRWDNRIDIKSKFHNFYLKDFFYYNIFKNIKIDLPLNYVNYNHGEVENTLINKCNWCYYDGHHFESAFTKFSVGYYLPKKFNIDRRKVDLSARIRERKINRNDALEILKTPIGKKINPNLINYVLSKLEISKNDFDKILSKKNKNFKDFKSYYSLIKKMNLPIKIAVKLGLVPKILYYKFKA